MTGSVLSGRAGSPGVGVGIALLVGEVGTVAPLAPYDPGSAGGRPAHADPAAQAAMLRAALDAAATELTALATQTAERAGEEVGAIFEAQALFARDPGIVDPALADVATGVTAVDAILTITERQADALAGVDDEYFRERAADVRDVGRRIAALIRGDVRPDLWHADGRPAVLISPDLDPSAVAGLRRELVAGIVLGGGAPTGHAAIVARALGIPLVLGLGATIEGVPAGVEMAIDGSTGQVFVEPTPAVLARLLAAGTASSAAALGAAAGAAGTAALDTLATHGVEVAANVASAMEAGAAALAGAAGIGLVRTELLFLGRHAPPTVAEQRATYARIRAAMGDRPIVFRTLDVGGDKPASWKTGPVEANPALGVRGVRLGQRQPESLDDQLRALVEAAADKELRVMLPMVATREELDDVRHRLDAIVDTVASETGVRPDVVRLGVMIEVPSAAIMADALAEAADFFSIGTNDLVQYTLAADRTNPELADLASALQPSVLRLIDGVVRAARSHDRHVAVCGEAAADPAIVPVLVGLGVQELSVSPGAVVAVRSLVAGLDLAACVELAQRALKARTLGEVRALLA
ncbi:MAG: phosphoenolpyruvate--protein phosphotransferase [Candidatus Limnocylindrales bacterium]